MFRYNKIIILLILFLLSSCNAYKSISSKYNILYNGELFLNEGINQLRDSYKENFWEILPVIKENNITNSLPDYPTKNFLKSEEKAIKVIQKMGGDNNLESEYINEAYLLLGKSRFFDKRYISALQAFNYLIKQNDKSELWIEAFYWKTLININLEQFDTAISSVNKLLKDDAISNKSKQKLYSLKSEVYYKKKDYNKLIESLKNTIKNSIDKDELRRYKYIIGQTFLSLKEKDSASTYFKDVININASKFSNIYLDTELKISLINDNDYDSDYFKKKLNQPRNYLSKGKINYYYAKNFIIKEDLIKGKTLLKNALKENQDDENLEKNIYYELFNINLIEKDYLNANSYLDSVIILTENSSKTFFTLNKKREKLNIITDLEKQNKLIDSLLYLNSLDQEALEKVLNQSQEPNTLEIKLRDNNLNIMGVFYFNNRTAINNGQKQFIRTWGKRERADNWRFSTNNFSNQTESKPINIVKESNNIGSNELKTFVQFSENQIDSLYKILNTNYFKKGLYLFEYLDDFESSLESFLNIDKDLVTDSEYIQSRYYLYRIFSSGLLKNEKETVKMKNLIIKNYPNSIYAKMLLNNKYENKIEFNKYMDSLKNNLNDKKLNTVIKSIDSVLPLLSKRKDRYDLLLFKSDIEAKSKGIENYLKSLRELIQMFPEMSNSLVEKTLLIENYINQKSLSIKDETYVSFIVVKNEDDPENINNNKLKLVKYDDRYSLISFYNFKSKNEARYRLEETIKKYKNLSNNKYFVISTPQYINMLIFKTLDIIK
jgi:hypothetical protein